GVVAALAERRPGAAQLGAEIRNRPPQLEPCPLARRPPECSPLGGGKERTRNHHRPQTVALPEERVRLEGSPEERPPHQPASRRHDQPTRATGIGRTTRGCSRRKVGRIASRRSRCARSTDRLESRLTSRPVASNPSGGRSTSSTPAGRGSPRGTAPPFRKTTRNRSASARASASERT